VLSLALIDLYRESLNPKYGKGSYARHSRAVMVGLWKFSRGEGIDDN
jgi:stalled ribosome alternative rescue factor ArfA